MRTIKLGDTPEWKINRGPTYVNALKFYLKHTGLLAEWTGRDFKIREDSPLGNQVWYFFWNGTEHYVLDGPCQYICQQLSAYGNTSVRDIADILIQTPEISVKAEDVRAWYSKEHVPN